MVGSCRLLSRRAAVILALAALGAILPGAAAQSSWEEARDLRGTVHIHCTADFTMPAGAMTVTMNRSGKATIAITGTTEGGGNGHPVGRITGNLDVNWRAAYTSGGGSGGTYSGTIDQDFGSGAGAGPRVWINREEGLYVIALPHCRAEGTATINAMSGTRTKDGARDAIQPHVPDNFRSGAEPRTGGSYDPESGIITGNYSTTVDETIGSSFYGFACSGPVTVTANWHLETKRPKLKADAGGPYTVERGGTLDLDGSGSTGWITDHEWRFWPAGGCPARARLHEAEKHGPTPTVVPLCPMMIILIVTDGDDESSDMTTIDMTPRQWHTTFSHEPGEVELEDASPPWAVLNHPEHSAYQGAANICALDTTQEDDHNFHPPAASGSWEGGGYVLRQVNDPGGPFHHWWFVSRYDLVIHRVTAINRYLVPWGRPPLSEMVPFYDYNEAQGMDVAGYLQAVRDHEYEHSRRREAALTEHDPAIRIEKEISLDRGALKQAVDTIIREAERAVCLASADPLPLSWRGELWFPVVNTGRYEVKSVVEVGGPKQIHEGERCSE